MSTPAILIVDDEPDIRELLAMTIRRMGFEAFCADNLEGAHPQAQTPQRPPGPAQPD